MMYAAWVGMTDALMSASSAAAAQEQQHVTFVQDNATSVQDAIHLAPPSRAALHPGDCSSCGSQEFRRWHGVSVCAYCRSVAEVARPRFDTKHAERTIDALVPLKPGEEKLEMWQLISQSYATNRREAMVRITTE